MALGDFLRGIGAQLNPFDNGRTYGSYNPPQKKKLQPGDPGYVAPPVSVQVPRQNNQNLSNPIKTQTPENLFQGLNNDLNIKLPVHNIVTTPSAAPPLPKPSLFDKVGTGLKTVAGTVANIPEVGLAAVRAGTGIVQGATQLPHIVTAATATGTKKLNEIAPNSFTHALNTGAQAANTVIKSGTDVINKPINLMNRGIDNVAESYANHVPMATGGANVYKREQIPLNILAGLLTFGGSSAAEGAGQTGRIGEEENAFTRLLNKPRTSNPDNIVSRTGQVIANKIAPVAQVVNSPFSSTRNGVTRLINSRVVPGAERAGIDAGEIGNVLTEAQLQELTRPPTQIPVTQPQPIGVNAPPSAPVTIPVVNTTPIGPLIRDNRGDALNVTRVPTAEEAATQRAATRFKNQPPGRPDQNVSGINTDSNKIITTADKTEAQNVLDDKLATEQITPDEHKDLSDQLSKIPAQDAPVPKGQKIAVKQIDSIPIQNQTDIPAGLPETPGIVRTTEQTAPKSAETQAVANAPVVATPAQLPKETQNILDNPKQFSKRQVAARRNQRTLARKMAKTQEDTAEAISRIDTASPAAASGEGFVPTSEFGKSVNGGAYQKVGRASEMNEALHETANMSPGDVIKTARDNQVGSGTFNRRDIRNVMAMFESKRIARGTPEYNEAKQILKEDGTHQAQALALRGGNVIRRTATSDQLTGQFESKIYRMVDDPTKIDSKSFDDVDAAESKFTAARDDATAAYNRFTEKPTTANAKAYHIAQDVADQADKDAKTTEYAVAQKVLKGNKDPKQARELQKMAANADMYQMDAVDASMLSGTGTFSRNFVNAGIGGAEEGLFGKVGAKVANKITGENVGGGVGRGTLSGFGKGVRNIVDASKARAAAAGKNPLEHIKNWATTGNQLGDSIIDSQVSHNVLDHYTQELKDEGYKGSELRNRAGVMARQDPDNIGKTYAGYARAAAGLGSGITKGSKIESVIRDGISNFISGGNPNKVSEITAKLLTRMTVGFPSAIGRTIAEGGKRVTFGAPTALKLFSKTARNDPAVQAQIIKESIKQAGTGATAGAIFYKLGQDGLVTGSYPTDKEERARWQREGITENSIKIGDNYYQLPAFLGVAAVPALFAATLGRNNGDIGKSAEEVAKGLPSILPTDQASNVLDFIDGKTDSASKFLTQTGASAVRALEPGGALLNQIAKSFDPTQNDTTDGTALQNFVNKVLSGIPGENEFTNIPDKTDDAGNVLHNPSALPLAAGAASTTQNKGVEHTADINEQTNSTLKTISDVGGLSDPNIKKVLDAKTLQIYNQVQAGKQVSPDDLTNLQNAMVRGVSSNGDDTAYLEKEQYDSNLTALNLKRNLMAADPTTKPSDLAKMDTAIKRGQVYKDKNIPYDQISAYEGTSLSDWRDMGDPKSDNYDPDEYQTLWNVDQALAKAGGSYNKISTSKPKYSAKQSGSGSGSRGGYSSDFGTLKAGVGAPTVQAYDSVDQATGSVPIIQVQRPNIVHKISTSG